MIFATDYGDLQGDSGDGQELRAWEDAERGPVELVEDGYSDCEGELCMTGSTCDTVEPESWDAGGKHRAYWGWAGWL